MYPVANSKYLFFNQAKSDNNDSKRSFATTINGQITKRKDIF